MDNQFLISSARHPDGYFNEKDNILDGFTLEEVVMTLHNESGELTKEKLMDVMQRILGIRLHDMWNIINANDKEIIDLAYQGRSDNPKKKTILFDPAWVEKAEALQKDVVDYLIKNDCWRDVALYYNGKCKTMDKPPVTGSGDVMLAKVRENVDPRRYFKYVREPNIFSMSFEGRLYEILNYEDMFVFENIFKKYGLYYELGDAWNLSAYPIDE